jgi:hypothetical protein
MTVGMNLDSLKEAVANECPTSLSVSGLGANGPSGTNVAVGLNGRTITVESSDVWKKGDRVFERYLANTELIPVCRALASCNNEQVTDLTLQNFAVTKDMSVELAVLISKCAALKQVRVCALDRPWNMRSLNPLEDIATALMTAMAISDLMTSLKVHKVKKMPWSRLAGGFTRAHSYRLVDLSDSPFSESETFPSLWKGLSLVRRIDVLKLANCNLARSDLQAMNGDGAPTVRMLDISRNKIESRSGDSIYWLCDLIFRLHIRSICISENPDLSSVSIVSLLERLEKEANPVRVMCSPDNLSGAGRRVQTVLLRMKAKRSEFERAEAATADARLAVRLSALVEAEDYCNELKAALASGQAKVDELRKEIGELEVEAGIIREATPPLSQVENLISFE